MKSMSRVSKILTSVTKMDFLMAEKRKNAFLSISSKVITSHSISVFPVQE